MPDINKRFLMKSFLFFLNRFFPFKSSQSIDCSHKICKTHFKFTLSVRIATSKFISSKNWPFQKEEMNDNEKYEYNERSESNVNRAASDAMTDKAKIHLQMMESNWDL